MSGIEQSGIAYTRNTQAQAILVPDEETLAALPPCQPGSIAYTAGFREIWQLGLDGEWVSVTEITE